MSRIQQRAEDIVGVMSDSCMCKTFYLGCLMASPLMLWITKSTNASSCETIDNADANLSCSSNFDVGSSCVVTCAQPKRPSITNVTCAQIEPNLVEWSPAKPVCLPACWPKKILLQNGSVACTDENFLDSVCSFFCDHSYLISETSSIVTCADKSETETYEWDRSPPSCIKIPVRCPELNPLFLSPNLRYNCSNEDFEGSVCSFACDGRAEISGSNSSTCINNFGNGVGLWNPDIPRCASSFCEVPVIENGNITCDKYIPGAVCTISCSPGFQPSSFIAFNCDEFGRWTGNFPTCMSSMCRPALQAIIGIEVNCTQKNLPGSVCEVLCRDSSHKETVSCPANDSKAGFWTGNLSQCIGCGKGLMDLLLIIDGSSNMSPYGFQQINEWLGILFTKLENFFDSGASWISVVVTGGRGDSQECEPSTSKGFIQKVIPFRHMSSDLLRRKLLSLEQIGGCLHLSSAIEHSFVEFSGNLRSSIPSIVMVVVAGKSVEDSENVTEEIKTTYDSKFIAVGINLPQGSSLSHIAPEALSYIPSVDMLSSSSMSVLNMIIKRTCRGLSMCADQPIENGELDCSQIPANKKLLDEICTTSCSSGSTLVGNVTSVCSDTNGDGIMKWIAPQALCTVVGCPPVPVLENGRAACTNGSAFLSVCIYDCLPDYHMIGMSQSFCGDPENEGIGRWSSEIPQCVKNLTCEPNLESPFHGSLDCSLSSSFGSECHFSCDEGYELSGGGIIHCGNALPDGNVEWQNTPPTCEECKFDSCKLDMVILLDGSSSIRGQEFWSVKHLILNFLQEYEGEIDHGATRVGLIQYSGDASFMCSSGEILPKYEVTADLAKRSFRDIRRRIEQMGHLKGCSATGDAIVRAVQHLEEMGRTQVESVILLVTDGFSNDDVTKPGKQARDKGYKIVTVPVGEFETYALQSISSSNVLVDVPDFNELESSISEIKEKIWKNIQGESFSFSDHKKWNATLLVAFTLVIHLLG